ncbi:unnamed protein product, partial [Heterotrigona itama]
KLAAPGTKSSSSRFPLELVSSWNAEHVVSTSVYARIDICYLVMSSRQSDQTLSQSRR